MIALRAFLTVFAIVALAHAAAAETKLTDFNGEWHGVGHDRESALQFLQDTSCKTVIRADLTHMHTEMTCARKSGLSKYVRLTVVLEGDRFSGKISQRTKQPGHEDAVINGSIVGKKTDQSANFLVTWKGATPNTTVDLRLISPTSYSMQAVALGITVLDVTFNRQSR